MNLSSALPILFSTLSIIILPSSKTLVDAQIAVVRAQPDQPTITSTNGGLERYRFCGSARNERCIISGKSAEVIDGVPGEVAGVNNNRDDCTGGLGSNNGQCAQDDLYVESIRGQPPAGQGTCEVEQCDPTSLDPTCVPIDLTSRDRIYWRQSATNRVYTKTTTCTYRVCSKFENSCDTALVTWTINPLLEVEDRTGTLSEDESSIEFRVIRDNVISTRDTRVTRIVSPNPTFGTCEVIPDPSFANGKRIRYTRPSNTFDDSAFSPPTATCNYEVCTIPLAGETSECKEAKIDITVEKPQASITVRPNTYNINLNTDVVDNQVVLSPTPLENDKTNPPGRPIVVARASGPSGAGNGRCLVDAVRNTVVFNPGNNNQAGQTVTCTYEACTSENGADEQGIPIPNNPFGLGPEFVKKCGTNTITLRFTDGARGIVVRDDEVTLPRDRNLDELIDVLDNDNSIPRGRRLRVANIVGQIPPEPNRGQCSVGSDRFDNDVFVRYRRQNVGDNRPVQCTYQACTDDGAPEFCGEATVTINFGDVGRFPSKFVYIVQLYPFLSLLK